MARIILLLALLGAGSLLAGCGSSATATPQERNTAGVSQQASALLLRLATAASELGADRVQRDGARQDLDNLWHSAATVRSDAVGGLAADNPARPVFVMLAGVMQSTATALNRAGASPALRGTLGNVDTTLRDLATVSDDITTHVPAADRQQIARDVAVLDADLRLAAHGK
jgi:hypothetical protein